MAVETRAYGVECKNPECHTGIMLGTYQRLVAPARGGERIDFPDLNPTRIRCPSCGTEFEYTASDLREFPDAPLDSSI